MSGKQSDDTANVPIFGQVPGSKGCTSRKVWSFGAVFLSQSFRQDVLASASRLVALVRKYSLNLGEMD